MCLILVKLECLGYRFVKKLRQCSPERNRQTDGQTDRQTDGQTDRIAISILRNKNVTLFMSLWFLQTLINFYNIWNTVYRLNFLQHNNSKYCCCTTSEKDNSYILQQDNAPPERAGSNYYQHYLCELCKPCTDNRLRSKSRGDFITPRTRLRFTDRAISAPSAWNSLPIDIRDCSNISRLSCFMQLLISISILLFSFYSTLSIVLYGAVKHWMSGALVSLGDMIGYMMKL